MNISVKKISKGLVALLIFFSIVLSTVFSINIFADNSNKVKVAFFTDRPYFMKETENGIKSGYSYDYLQMLSNYTGWEYEYVYGTHAELTEKFLNNEIDVFPAIAKSSLNDGKMVYSAQPVGSAICRLYVLNNNTKIVYNKPETLNGITIGVTKNNAFFDMFVQKIKEDNINCQFITFDSYYERNEAFDNGEIDAVIDFEALAKENWNPIKVLGSYDYYLAVSNESSDLIDEIDTAMEVIYDRSPYYNSILYYNNYSKNASLRAISSDEIEWVSSNYQLRIGVINKYLNLNNSSNNSFIKAIMEKVMNQLNLDNMEIVYVEYSSYDALLKALKDGDIDVAYPLSNEINIAEKEGYSIVDTFETTPMDIVTNKMVSINELHTIVVPDKKIYAYCQVNFPNSEIICLKSKKECLDAVSDNIVDAAVIPCHLSVDELQSSDDYDDFIFTEYHSMGSCLAVRKDQNILFSLLRRGVNSVDDEYINHISIVKGTSEDSDFGMEDFVYEYYWLINVILILIGVLILGIIIILLTRRRNIKRHKEAAIYQCALYSQAIGYYQCNLTKNIMLSPYMKMVNGEPIDIVDYIPNNGNTPFSSLMDYIASHFVLSDVESFRKFMNPDKLIECYNGGDFKPEFSCWVLVPNEGRKVFQRYTYFLSKDNNNDIIATCILYDNSEYEGELEKQRNKAESANIAKSTFLFNMTHDVRTPMNAIIGYANMAEKNIKNTDKVIECINKIQSSSNQLLTLLDDALDMSRAESGKIIIKESIFVFTEYMKQAIPKIIERGKKSNIDIKFNISSIKDIKISADIIHLNKILFNIVDNAIKYNKPNGTVNIEISQKTSEKLGYINYIFVVSDTGIGMSEEFKNQIFEMFARENTSTISGIHGTGVGMTITKRLVDLLGGKIHIESTKNIGTTVTLDFDFKVYTEPIKPKVQEISEKKEISLAGKRILLVEDIDLNREIAREILEEEAIVVEEAVDGSVAVKMISESEPGYYDLVFMDIQMPIMDGYEATRTIRNLENRRLAEIPIVAMTANALDEDIQNCLESGMNAHLVKPIDIVKMFDTIRKYIKE